MHVGHAENAKVAKLAKQFNYLFFVFNISFLPNYIVKYYDYTASGAEV